MKYTNTVQLEERCFTKHKRQAGRRKGRKMSFLFMVILTFDLDIQTRPSEGPNTSSLWIWCKSVQRSRYFIHKQKVTDSTKHSSLRMIKMHYIQMSLIWTICLCQNFVAGWVSVISVMVFQLQFQLKLIILIFSSYN